MKRTILYILGLGVLLSSCSDFLVREPELQQSTQITLSTYEGLKDATFGTYASFSSAGWYGNAWIIDAEMRSGNGHKSQYRESGRCVQPYQWSYNENSTSSMWAYCYQTVAMANNVIDNLEGKDVGGVTKQDLDNLKAECLFMRAFSHFCNVLTYGMPYTYCKKHDVESLGVPYIYHTDPQGLPSRETVISNYENIVKDLLEAEKIIAPDYVHQSSVDPAAVASLQTIQALLSRVYLYMEDWQNAADYATKVINSGKYTMWSASEYNEVWGADLGSGEVIFEVYGKRTNSTNPHWDDLSWLTSPDGSGDPQAARPLLDTYEENDVRLALYRTPADDSACPYKWTGKYPGKGDNVPDCNNVIILRLSEMYLNRAEAIMRGAKVDGTTAVNDINQVASRRGATPYKSVGPEDIRQERRRELAWEGLWLYDLARWDMAVERTATDYPLLPMESLNIPKPSQSFKWALPIPKRELDLNSNLVQNKL